MNRTRDDDEVVGGTTALDIRAAVRAADDSVELTWLDDTVTTVSVSLTPTLGTGKLAQRRDCAGCPVSGQIGLECPPDGLVMDLVGTIASADGRLGEDFEGTVTGRGAGPLEWSAYAMIPEAELLGSLDPRVVGEEFPVGGDVEVILWIDGHDDVLDSVSVGLEVRTDDYVRIGALGGSEEDTGSDSVTR